MDGLKYTGKCGNPASNPDLGLVWCDEVRPIGDGDGEVRRAVAEKWAATGQFEIVEIPAETPESAPTSAPKSRRNKFKESHHG